MNANRETIDESRYHEQLFCARVDYPWLDNLDVKSGQPVKNIVEENHQWKCIVNKGATLDAQANNKPEYIWSAQGNVHCLI